MAGTVHLLDHSSWLLAPFGQEHLVLHLDGLISLLEPAFLLFSLQVCLVA